LKQSKLQEYINNRHGGVTVVGHDEISLRAQRACFDSRTTLPKSGFASVDKTLLVVSCQVTFEVTKSKKPYTIAEELIVNHIYWKWLQLFSGMNQKEAGISSAIK